MLIDAINKVEYMKTDRVIRCIIFLAKGNLTDLSKYIETGVDELAQEKLPDLLKIKYQSLEDAKTAREKLAEEQKNTFEDFISTQEKTSDYLLEQISKNKENDKLGFDERCIGNYADDKNIAPFVAFEAEKEANILRNLVLQLPADQQEVIILKHWGNLKFREIAEQIGENINTVQGRFRYGIKKLKEMLKQQQIEITIN